MTKAKLWQDHNARSLKVKEWMPRGLRDFRVFLVVNMVKSTIDLKYAAIFASMRQDLLSIQPAIMGHVPFGAGIEPAISQMVPFPLHHKRSKAEPELNQTALNLLRNGRKI
jgi:MinD-like ATPase involved in chromosome partitioning or flagellar assembly